VARVRRRQSIAIGIGVAGATPGLLGIAIMTAVTVAFAEGLDENVDNETNNGLGLG
jgi:hypothetical protein